MTDSVTDLVIDPADESWPYVNVLGPGNLFDVNVAQYGSGGQPGTMGRAAHIFITTADSVQVTVNVDGKPWNADADASRPGPAAYAWAPVGAVTLPGKAVVMLGPMKVDVAYVDNALTVDVTTNGAGVYVEFPEV